MKKLFSILAVVLAIAAVLSSCKKEDETVTNKMTLRGTTYSIVHAICGEVQSGYYNLDVDTEGGALHGYGGFPTDYVGKTTSIKGSFFLSFNPQSGSSIDPVLKSGTVKVTKVKGGLNIKVDGVEEGGDKFTMDIFAEDLGKDF